MFSEEIVLLIGKCIRQPDGQLVKTEYVVHLKAFKRLR